MRGRRYIVGSSEFLIAIALLLAASSIALSQARHSAQIQGPHDPGWDSQIAPHGPGGAVSGGAYQGDAGPLRSDNSAQGLTRRSVQPVRASEAPPSQDDSDRLRYRPAPLVLAPPRPVSAWRGAANEDRLPLPVLLPYLHAVRSPAASWLSVGPEVRTLVPPGTGLVHDHMLKAENALRQGMFLEASGEYRLANIYQPGLAEPLLGLALTSFASAEHSYAAAAVHLQSALRALPSLPRIKLRPAQILAPPAAPAPAAAPSPAGPPDAGQVDLYCRSLTKLEGHLREAPEDAEALLVLGAMRWFDGSLDQARDALARAELARLAQRRGADVPVDPVLDAIRDFQAVARQARKP